MGGGLGLGWFGVMVMGWCLLRPTEGIITYLQRKTKQNKQKTKQNKTKQNKTKQNTVDTVKNGKWECL